MIHLYMSLQSTAQSLGITQDELGALIQQGKLTTYQVNGQQRIRIDDLKDIPPTIHNIVKSNS